jgi:hypothetical protein
MLPREVMTVAGFFPVHVEQDRRVAGAGAEHPVVSDVDLVPAVGGGRDLPLEPDPLNVGVAGVLDRHPDALAGAGDVVVEEAREVVRAASDPLDGVEGAGDGGRGSEHLLPGAGPDLADVAVDEAPRRVAVGDLRR